MVMVMVMVQLLLLEVLLLLLLLLLLPLTMSLELELLLSLQVHPPRHGPYSHPAAPQQRAFAGAIVHVPTTPTAHARIRRNHAA